MTSGQIGAALEASDYLASHRARIMESCPGGYVGLRSLNWGKSGFVLSAGIFNRSRRSTRTISFRTQTMFLVGRLRFSQDLHLLLVVLLLPLPLLSVDHAIAAVVAINYCYCCRCCWLIEAAVVDAVG